MLFTAEKIIMTAGLLLCGTKILVLQAFKSHTFGRITINSKKQPLLPQLEVISAARSKSVPFLEQPFTLADSSLPGNAQFDPLGLSTIWKDRDWSDQLVPNQWDDPPRTVQVTTLDWMREAETKHSRIAMLAVVGWIATEYGLRFPGEKFASIANPLAAHNAAVANGSMGFMLCLVVILEVITGCAIVDQAKASGRKPGDFSFNPLGFGNKDAKTQERLATNEIKNGRLAMLAISGIVTQAALFPEKSFPYL